MVEAIKKKNWARAKAAIEAYGKARKRFRKTQKELPALLGGNDNKVGICGEFWAKWFYDSQGYTITEVPRSNNPGYDFRCAKGKSRGARSVKVVSDESSAGRQAAMRLKRVPAEWDEIALVLLDTEMQAYCIGVASCASLRRPKPMRLLARSRRLHGRGLRARSLGWPSTEK